MNFVHAAVEAVESLLSELDLDIMVEEQPELYDTLRCSCRPRFARMSELFGLKWHDIDFQKNEISMTRSIVFQVVGPASATAAG